MKSKGQAAMEFLMTYGWAILVVLIAVGALAYFGLLSPDKLLSDRCVITPGSGIVCDDYTSSATSQNIRLNLGNALNEDISITAVDANYTIGGAGGTCAALGGAVSLPSGTSDNTLTLSSCTQTSGNKGKKIKGDLAFTYTVGGGLTRSTVGSVVITVGT